MITKLNGAWEITEPYLLILKTMSEMTEDLWDKSFKRFWVNLPITITIIKGTGSESGIQLMNKSN